MHPIKLVAALSSFSLVSSTLAAPTTTQLLMRQKLESTHGLFEGLIREDFDAILKHATALENISKATTWHKLEDPAFLAKAQTFQNSASFLAEQAKDKNLEGVAIGYMRITLDCMQCHNFVRKKPLK